MSVNRWFRNVNWVAIPGYEFFYQGNLKFGERLTQGRCQVNSSRSEKPESRIGDHTAATAFRHSLAARFERSAALIARRDGVES